MQTLIKTGLVAVALALNWGAASPASDIGRQIYRGIASEPATSRAVVAGISVPAHTMPCANCHGRDASGSDEGGIGAPAITAERLFARTSDRPAYTALSFTKALRDGEAPGGRALHPVMPRYRFSSAETKALLGYLGEVRGEQRTGVAGSEIRFGIIVPQGLLSDGELIRALFMEAWALLGDPRPHGRRITIDVIELDAGSSEAKRKLIEAQVFALLLAVPDAERELLAAAADLGIPIVLPFGQALGIESPLDIRTAFASLRDEIHAVIGPAGPNLAIVADDQSAARLRELSITGPYDIGSVEDFVRSRTRPRAVLLAAGPEAMKRSVGLDLTGIVVYRLMSDVIRAPWTELTESGADVLVTVPYDRAAKAVTLNSEALAALAARLVRDALAAAGRDLTRTSFMAAFDQLSFNGREWFPLDFKKHPLTGTNKVHFLRSP